MQKIILLLPAYNEAESLPNLLERVDELKTTYHYPIEVLIVNDGSSDETLNIARSYGDSFVDIQPNSGLANVLRVGINRAIEMMNHNDILVIMDADDSHPPGLIPRMVQQINEGSDIVIASRYVKGSRIKGLSGLRKFLSRIASFIFQIFTPIKGVKDYTCGYRAYRVQLLKEMVQKYEDKLIEEKGFGSTAEILLKSRKFKPIVHEVPFILRYDLKLSDSKMNVSKTIKQTLKLIFKNIK